MTHLEQAGRVALRPATAADMAVLIEHRLAMMNDIFGLEVGLPAGTETLRSANEKWMAEHFGRDFSAWIAELDGRPVASAGLMWFEHPPGPVNPAGREAYILNVYTRPEARRMGLARALFQKLVDEAKAAGVRRIWLRASDEGRPLYESMGFATGNYLQLRQDDGTTPVEPRPARPPA
jgi:GNAT superfamily N-acetyltransferase